MNSIPASVLVILLIVLILVSAFFSSAETGLMSLNRYRLRHLARQGHKVAQIVSKLLERPDRLLGVILIGNTFANIVASSIATILVVRWVGDIGVVIATIVLTFIILIFAEIGPKTFAALYSQRISFFSAYPLRFLLKVLYPIVWLANGIVNNGLKALGIHIDKAHVDRLSADELRTVVLESTGRISPHHQDMLLRLLEMEEVSVDDVMIPRNEIVGIDVNDDWSTILNCLTNTVHSKLPLYRDDINNVIGIIYLPEALKLLSDNKLSKTTLLEIARDVYFVPEGTSLNGQLLNFRKAEKRSALVVDEYGDIQGLVTIEDILEEIVGELAQEEPSVSKAIQTNADGSVDIEGSVNIRELNRLLDWDLPVDGPKTLSGLIIEHLETIPEFGACLMINGYPIEILKVEGNLITRVRVMAQLRALLLKKEE